MYQKYYSTSSGNEPATPSPSPPRPSRNLHGKVAIITGAGSRGSEIGNGRATALLLAEDGASVVCVDKDLSLAQRTVSMIPKANPNSPSSIAIAADVTTPQDCSRVVAATLATFRRLDILVNIVGVLGAKGSAVDVDLDEWARGMDINVTSMMLMARYAIPAMMENQRTPEEPIRGSIVNVGSVAGLRGGTPHLLYPTSKGAVVNMTRAMAALHGREGVRVNCVCPGMLYTPMMYGDGMTAEVREARRNRSLLGTEGNAWDCASAIRFLAGDEARWVTGAILPVDAGATAAVSFSLAG
ncbi:Short-chain dehydrogenase reductase 2a [Madurella mycetomatis]|uniref:Short-chain dehydrogenase reductase 2a n=1 Tax=Madurella mycetomatis TaxID=100816 RepID=A0A175WGW1_9PEZI|nr:Short-chain dehydrogenase reductase 2a [Madurella mycetomatis]